MLHFQSFRGSLLHFLAQSYDFTENRERKTRKQITVVHTFSHPSHHLFSVQDSLLQKKELFVCKKQYCVDEREIIDCLSI